MLRAGADCTPDWVTAVAFAPVFRLVTCSESSGAGDSLGRLKESSAVLQLAALLDLSHHLDCPQVASGTGNSWFICEVRSSSATVDTHDHIARARLLGVNHNATVCGCRPMRQIRACTYARPPCYIDITPCTYALCLYKSSPPSSPIHLTSPYPLSSYSLLPFSPVPSWLAPAAICPTISPNTRIFAVKLRQPSD